MNDHCCQRLKCEYFMVSLHSFYSKLNIFGLLTKQDIGGRRLGLLGNTHGHFSAFSDS